MNYLLKEFEEPLKSSGNPNISENPSMSLLLRGSGKLYKMPEDAQLKLQETLQKIINEGSGGLICIIL